MTFCTGENHTEETGREPSRFQRGPCMDGTGLGTEVLSEKRTGIQVQTAANNTVGIIDSDYYYSDNEGQIFAKITK